MKPWVKAILFVTKDFFDHSYFSLSLSIQAFNFFVHCYSRFFFFSDLNLLLNGLHFFHTKSNGYYSTVSLVTIVIIITIKSIIIKLFVINIIIIITIIIITPDYNITFLIII